LGVLHVANAGALLTFAAETGVGADPSPWYRANLNETGKAIDFGDVRTDGSAWLRREGNTWVVLTWPRERAFNLELSRQRFDQPAQVQSVAARPQP